MSDILSFGEPMVEFNSEALGGPRAGSVFSAGFGGDSSNFAVAARRLGGRVSYLTRVGADPFGGMLQQLWHDEGIDASHVIVDEDHPTGLYFILRHGAMSEFQYRRKGSAAAHLVPGDLPTGWVEGGRLLHVTGITQAISSSAQDTVFEAIERARVAQTLVTYDPNIRPALWPLHTARAVVKYTIPLCDVILPNLDEGRLLTGREEPRAITQELLGMGAQMVVLKMGGSGAVVATADEFIPVRTREVVAQDPTGAGDTFDAGFAVALVEGRSPAEAAMFASAAASRVVQGLGAVSPIPRRSEADAIFQELAAQPA